MSSATRFPNRLCARGSRLHRSESLRHSDSELSPSSADGSDAGSNGDGDGDSSVSADRSDDSIAPDDTKRASSIDSENVSGRLARTDRLQEPQSDIEDDIGDHIIDIDRTPPHHRVTITERHLRESILRLQDNLNTSTAIVNNLQARDKFHRLDGAAKKAEARRIRECLCKAKRAVARERMAKLVLMGALCIVVLMLVAYCYLAWMRGPEMEYVRRRRAEILLE